MKNRLRIVSLGLAFIITLSSVFTGCGNNNTMSTGTSNSDIVSESKDPMILFGENITLKGMSYSIEGEDTLESGSILSREYSKIKTKVALNFKLEDKYVKEFEGKKLMVKLEYYDSSSKSYKVTYTGTDGDTTLKFDLSGTNTWGGRVIKIADMELSEKANSHFSVSLDTATSLWIRSVTVCEDKTTEKEYPILLETEYETSNGKVINADIRDYGAVGDGKTDDSLAFQTALREMSKTGGVLYIPSGIYKLTQDMVIPSGITLLGDFNTPSRDNPKVKGTILAAYVPTIADGNKNLFMNMRAGSCIKGLNIWYPEQTLSSGEAEPYNYTIGISQNIGVTIEDIYLVNSYDGITHKHENNQHYQQMVKNVYGTPLHIGYYAGMANDSDRQQIFDFSPKFWLGSGLAGTPDKQVLETWLMTYGTGFSLGDIDFHYVADVSIEGYKIGMFVRRLYGRIYNFNITDCNVCMYIEDVVIYGGQLTKGVLKANGGENPVALLVGENVTEGFSGTMLEISSTGKYAVNNLGTGAMTIQDSTISVTDSNAIAAVHSGAGRMSLINTVLDGGNSHVLFDESIEESSILNCSAKSGELKIDSAESDKLTVETNEKNVCVELDTEEFAAADAQRAYQDKGPAAAKLYNIADYGSLEGEQPEISEALQKAIDAAYESGGGTVYIPAGVYRLENPITVKSGVEVCGISDYFHYIAAAIPSSTLLTDYGKGNEAAKALVTLEQNSGIRGLSVVYDVVSQDTIQPYATTVQATGKDCYVINTTVVGGWYIADFDTYKCDNHYIESLNFFSFHIGIAMGGGSENGVLLNGHSNPGELWSTGYNDSEWSDDWTGSLMTYQHDNAINFYYGESTNQVAFMTATFGANKGVMIDDGADVTIIGHGTDYSVNGIYITGNSNAVIIDPQCIGSYQTEAYTSTAIVADDNFTGNLAIYNLCPWNINDTAIRVDNGIVSINGGFFLHSGKSPIIANGGNITMRGVIVKNRKQGDIVASSGVESVTAFGNIIYGTPKFLIENGVSVYGSDIK